MNNILYIFSGEKAQGAEIVIERMMSYNAAEFNTHLFIAPGDFARNLLKDNKPYKITTVSELRRLFRSNSNSFSFYVKAVRNHFKISYKVYQCLKKEQIDIVHANNIMAASYLLPVLFFSKLFLRKIIWIWSDHDMSYQSKLDTAISKIAARFYDCTLAVSHAVAKKYTTHNNKIQVLYNGLDLELFKPGMESRNNFRSNLNLPADAILLGMAAKITPGKGHVGLIEVFDKLNKRFANIFLILAGGFADDHPDNSEKVKNAIATNPNIIYTGFINDMASYYNGCDIIISNSDKTTSESLGTTIYEAMAFEKIVVASDTGGTPEIITNMVDGFLFGAEQQDELHAKLHHILTNYNLLDDIKTTARKTVKRNFNILKMVEEYNEVIKRLTTTKKLKNHLSWTA